MKFINTRPVDRAEPLRSALQQLGHQVLDVPLLALQSLALDAHLVSQYQEFLHANLVVVVSPIAATLGLTHYHALNLDPKLLQQKTWIAVGQATAHVLQQHGITSIVPEVETSEGMLSLPQINAIATGTVAFWRGIGGRTFMMSELTAKGCTVLNMLLYTRQLPAPEYLIQANAIEKGDMVLISSEASWHNWLKLLASLNYSLVDYHYMVLGDRVSDIVKQAGVSCLTVYTLKADELHQKILKCINDE